MDLYQIKASIDSENLQDRRKAITALKNYDAEIAVPLLLRRRHDSEFVIRSCVASGLGNKQSNEAYAALLEMVKDDRDGNVKAEAANSLGKYGKIALPILREAFYHSDHWLIRLSLFPILIEMVSDSELLDLSLLALSDSDVMVIETAIKILRQFAGTPHEQKVAESLLPFTSDAHWYLRKQTAHTLQDFICDTAKQTVTKLKYDEDHRVVAAALESLLPRK